MHAWLRDGVALFERAAVALRAAEIQAGIALGVTIGFQGYFQMLMQPVTSIPLLEEGVMLLEAAGDRAERANLLLHLGTCEIAAARFEEARQRYRLAGQLAESSGDHLTRLWTLFYQGVLALYTGDLAGAEHDLTICLTSWRMQHYRRGIASALSWLSEVARQQSQYIQAETYAREGLLISSAPRDTPGVARAFRELGALALELGDYEQAQYLLGESCAAFRTINRPWVYGRSRALLIVVEVQLQQIAAARTGCAELLELIHSGVDILIAEAVHSSALVLIAEGNDSEALHLLHTLDGIPGEHATLARAERVRSDLMQRLDPTQHIPSGPQADPAYLINRLTQLWTVTLVP
jgi:tetratricopeptide (TPR) repeat protein